LQEQCAVGKTRVRKPLGIAGHKENPDAPVMRQDALVQFGPANARHEALQIEAKDSERSGVEDASIAGEAVPVGKEIRGNNGA